VNGAEVAEIAAPRQRLDGSVPSRSSAGAPVMVGIAAGNHRRDGSGGRRSGEGRDIGTPWPRCSGKVYLPRREAGGAQQRRTGDDPAATVVTLQLRAGRRDRKDGRDRGPWRSDAVEIDKTALDREDVVGEIVRMAGAGRRCPVAEPRGRADDEPGVLPRCWPWSAARKSASRTLVNRIPRQPQAVVEDVPGVPETGSVTTRLRGPSRWSIRRLGALLEGTPALAAVRGAGQGRGGRSDAYCRGRRCRRGYRWRTQPLRPCAAPRQAGSSCGHTR